MTRRFLALAGMALLVCAAGQPVSAQLTRGFVVELEPSRTGEESSRQDHLWELQVQFKPMRLIWVDITNPNTGEQEQELIWYLVYRVQNVPDRRPPDNSDTKPINVEDPLPGEPMFVPEFTLVSADLGDQRIYRDAILPEAQAAIERRERQQLNNNVQIVGPIPPAREPDGSDEGVYYGVAIWRGVDPSIDNFVLYMSGFSSAYELHEGADGEKIVWRKNIAQPYHRPGDQYDASEVEIRRSGDPHWIYRPEQPLDEVLPTE